MNVGKKLKALREQAGLTQTAFAKKSKISQGKLSLVEGDKSDVRLSTIERYAKALGYSVEIVFRKLKGKS